MLVELHPKKRIRKIQISRINFRTEERNYKMRIPEVEVWLFLYVSICISGRSFSLAAGDTPEKELTIRSIDANSKSNSEQPHRVNLTCKSKSNQVPIIKLAFINSNKCLTIRRFHCVVDCHVVFRKTEESIVCWKNWNGNKNSTCGKIQIDGPVFHFHFTMNDTLLAINCECAKFYEILFTFVSLNRVESSSFFKKKIVRYCFKSDNYTISHADWSSNCSIS